MLEKKIKTAKTITTARDLSPPSSVFLFSSPTSRSQHAPPSPIIPPKGAPANDYPPSLLASLGQDSDLFRFPDSLSCHLVFGPVNVSRVISLPPFPPSELGPRLSRHCSLEQLYSAIAVSFQEGRLRWRNICNNLLLLQKRHSCRPKLARINILCPRPTPCRLCPFSKKQVNRFDIPRFRRHSKFPSPHSSPTNRSNEALDNLHPPRYL